MARVTFLLQEVPHYRIEFFNRLHTRLHQAGIEMRVLYGCDCKRTAGHGGSIQTSWAEVVPTWAGRVAGVDLVWQSCGNKLAGSDLIVVEQSNRLLINYWLQLRRYWSDVRVAFWGHGRNIQSQNSDGLRERWKRWWLRRIDWWFAYTELTRDYLLRQGIDAERLTVVNNSVDERQLLSGLERHQRLSTTQRQLGCADSAKVALYCGQLHQHKRLGFLLRAAMRVRELVPEFELLIVGDGPGRGLVEAQARKHHWIHYAGSVLGAERAKYWHSARVAMMPGLVGLVIVDSFITACPLVTTEQIVHSPEIAYLHSGGNGLMTSNDLESYAQAVATLLQDDRWLEQLRRGCRQSAQHYSLDNMVEHFASGVEQCLARAGIAAVV